MTPPSFVITGTDTGVGKTVFAAALAGALRSLYWKPVQTGADSDSATVAALSALPAAHLLPSAYNFSEPLSPHRAAELVHVCIAPEKLSPPLVQGPLVIEGAGGVLVPVTRELLFADLFARWGLPVILVARTALGTINHSLMSIEALRRRAVAIHGVAFVGDAVEDSEAAICAIGRVRRLGRLPFCAPLNAQTLRAAFARGFKLEDFR